MESPFRSQLRGFSSRKIKKILETWNVSGMTINNAPSVQTPNAPIIDAFGILRGKPGKYSITNETTEETKEVIITPPEPMSNYGDPADNFSTYFIERSTPGPTITMEGSTLNYTLSKAVRVLFIGDSQLAGRGAGTGSVQMDGARALSTPYRLAVQLEAAGFVASDQSSFDANNTSGNWASYDPRFALGSWSMTSSNSNIGGRMITATGATATPASFTPSMQVDTIELYTPRDTYGSILYNLDGGTDTSLSESGTAALVQTVLTAAKGTHTINLKRSSGTVYAHGFVAYDSSRYEFRIINASARGWTTADWLVNDKPWRGFGGINGLNPDIAIISLGTNDRRSGGGGINKATFKANMQLIINQAKLTASVVILMMPFPIDQASVATITDAELLAAYQELAAANNCALFRTDTYIGTWASPLVGTPADNLHWNATAYDFIAQKLVASIRTAGLAWKGTPVYVPPTPAGPPPVVAAFSSGESATSATSYTFASKTFAAGKIMVGIIARGNPGTNGLPTSVTIGGLSATLVGFKKQNSSTGAPGCMSLWMVDGNTATTADVVANFDSTMLRCGFVAWSVTGAKAGVPSYGAASSVSAGSCATSLNIPENGLLLAYGNHSVGTEIASITAIDTPFRKTQVEVSANFFHYGGDKQYSTPVVGQGITLSIPVASSSAMIIMAVALQPA